MDYGTGESEHYLQDEDRYNMLANYFTMARTSEEEGGVHYSGSRIRRRIRTKDHFAEDGGVPEDADTNVLEEDTFPSTLMVPFTLKEKLVALEVARAKGLECLRSEFQSHEDQLMKMVVNDLDDSKEQSEWLRVAHGGSGWGGARRQWLGWYTASVASRGTRRQWPGWHTASVASRGTRRRLHVWNTAFRGSQHCSALLWNTAKAAFGWHQQAFGQFVWNTVKDPSMSSPSSRRPPALTWARVQPCSMQIPHSATFITININKRKCRGPWHECYSMPDASDL
jgi:hypothetical protein